MRFCILLLTNDFLSWLLTWVKSTVVFVTLACFSRVREFSRLLWHNLIGIIYCQVPFVRFFRLVPAVVVLLGRLSFRTYSRVCPTDLIRRPGSGWL